MALNFNPPKANKISGLGAGSYQSVIYGVWDIGIHVKQFGNNPPKKSHEMVIGFEVNKRITEEGEYKGKRKVLSKRYSISSYEKSTLMNHLKILLADKAPTEKNFKEFDFESLIGLNCILGVTISETGFDNISSISPLIEGMPAITPEIPPIAPRWINDLAVKGGLVVEQRQAIPDDLPF